jgi:hypothetical protein
VLSNDDYKKLNHESYKQQTLRHARGEAALHPRYGT